MNFTRKEIVPVHSPRMVVQYFSECYCKIWSIVKSLINRSPIRFLKKQLIYLQLSVVSQCLCAGCCAASCLLPCLSVDQSRLNVNVIQRNGDQTRKSENGNMLAFQTSDLLITGQPNLLNHQKMM